MIEPLKRPCWTAPSVNFHGGSALVSFTCCIWSFSLVLGMERDAPPGRRHASPPPGPSTKAPRTINYWGYWGYSGSKRFPGASAALSTSRERQGWAKHQELESELSLYLERRRSAATSSSGRIRSAPVRKVAALSPLSVPLGIGIPMASSWRAPSWCFELQFLRSLGSSQGVFAQVLNSTSGLLGFTVLL